MTQPQTIDPVEFGRVLGRLDAIDASLREVSGRLVWRIDNLEERVEKLEQQAPTTRRWGEWVERGLVALVMLGLGVFGGKL